MTTMSLRLFTRCRLEAGHVRHAALVIAALGVGLCAAPMAHSQISTWTGNGANSNWTNSANWSPAGAPVNNGTVDLLMDGSVRSVSTMDVSYSIASIQFQAASLAMEVRSGSSSPLPTLSLFSPTGIRNLSAVEQQLNLPLALQVDQFWSMPAGGSVRINGPITGNFLNITLQSGTLDLRGDNSGFGTGQGGGLVIQGGVVQASAPSRVGALASDLELDGGTLRIMAAGDWTTRTGDHLVNTGGGTVDTNGFSVQMNAWHGRLNVHPGSRSFTKKGLGTLSLATTATFNEDYTLDVQQGTLELEQGVASNSNEGTPAIAVAAAATFDAGDAPLALNAIRGAGDIIGVEGLALVPQAAATNTFSGRLIGEGGMVVRMAEEGVQVLSGDNSQFFGDVVIQRGTLAVNSDSALGADGGEIRFTSQISTNATLRFDGSFTVSQNRGAIVLAHGTGQTNTFDTNGNNVALPAGFSDASQTWIKTGAGTLTLGGDNSSQSATTLIRGGTLSVANFANLTSGPVRIADTGQGVLLISGPSSTGAHAIQLGPANGSGSGTIEVSEATSTVTLTGALTGGKLVKDGLGTLVLTSTTAYTGGTQVKGGRLAGSLTTIRGDFQIDAGGTIALNAGTSGPIEVNVSGAGTIELDAPGVWSFKGATNAFAGTVRVKKGSLTVNAALGAAGGTLVLDPSTALTLDRSVNLAVLGAISSSITPSLDVSLGDAASFAGFNTAGSLTVGGRTVTLRSAGLAGLGAMTTLNGGTIVAANGVTLGDSEALQGSGRVNGRVSGFVGSTIAATGSLRLGDAAAVAGYQSQGDLYIGAHTVTLDDANDAVLGSLTTIAGGTLQARANAAASDTHAHFLVGPGDNLTGRGTIAGNFKNNGHVMGDGTGAGQRVVFAAPWKVTGKGTFENTLVLGTFAPGESPGVVDGKNMAFGGAIELELGGSTPGAGPNHYDQVNDVAALTLVDEVDVKILPFDGFLPAIGDRFELLTWQDALIGDLGDLLVDPWFAAQGIGFDLLVDSPTGPGSLSLLTRAVAWGPGDFNRDGRVDAFDLAKWDGDFGAGGGSDANDDGVSDGNDFLAWQRNLWNGSIALQSAVPEPESALLLLAAFGGALGRSATRKR